VDKPRGFPKEGMRYRHPAGGLRDRDPPVASGSANCDKVTRAVEGGACGEKPAEVFLWALAGCVLDVELGPASSEGFLREGGARQGQTLPGEFKVSLH
jgi:hypothetical protein